MRRRGMILLVTGYALGCAAVAIAFAAIAAGVLGLVGLLTRRGTGDAARVAFDPVALLLAAPLAALVALALTGLGIRIYRQLRQ